MTAIPHLTVKDVHDVAWRALGKDWAEDSTVREAINACAQGYAATLRKLAARKDRPGRLQRRHEYRALGDSTARFCCLLLAWPKYFQPVGYEAAVQMCADLDPRRDCGEPVSYFYRSKPGGGRRLIVKFGPRRRTLQRLVVDILRASHGESPFDYCRKGRGTTRAMLAMQSAVTKKGARWFSTSDVRDCYGSFDRQGVIAQLRLPRSVIENSLLITPDTPIETGEVETEEESRASEQAARRGIPQGSLASPYIAASLLSPALKQLTGELVLIHGDDVITGTKTQTECEANAQALAEACLQHPAGPLLMKHNRVAKIGTPIEALGYRMKWRPEAFGGGVRFIPSKAAFEKFYARLEADLLKGKSWKDLPEQAAKRIPHWQAGLPLWDRSSAADDIVLIHVLQYVVAPVRTQLMKAAKVGIYASHGSD